MRLHSPRVRGWETSACRSARAFRSRFQGDPDVLDLRVGEQRLDALAAAVAGAAHAAERELDAAADPVAVDEHLPGADAGGHAVRAGEVLRPHARDEPVG